MPKNRGRIGAKESRNHMGQVRSISKDDIPHIAELYQRVHGNTKSPASEALELYLEEIYFYNPWFDESLPSLVYQNEHGSVVGFLGVIPRRMVLKGRPIRVAVANSFMVDPHRRHTLGAVQLLKTFLAGPQDLSMTDGANEASRQIWERFGGSTVPLYSLCWTRLLRPAQYALDFLKCKRRWLSPFLKALRPVGFAVDAVTARLPPNSFSHSPAYITSEDPDPETLLACIVKFSRSKSMRPEYEKHSLAWLLNIAAQKRGYGTLKTTFIRNAKCEVVGWYLYYQNPGAVSHVLQIVATKKSIHQVLDYLFADAWRAGSIAVRGRLEPEFMTEFSESHCSFHTGSYMLVHSNDPDILRDIYRGDAFLTRLEGEWWTRFLEFVH